MAKKGLILIGGGGHCKACMDVIDRQDQFTIEGVLATPQEDKHLPALIKKHPHVLIAIGSLKDPAKRIEKFEQARRSGAKFPVVISPYAYVSPAARIGEGTIIMHGAIINAGAKVGKNCIINTGALVEHHAEVGDHTHIATRVVVNGGCRIGTRVFIGSNSVIVHDVHIADDVVIGAGAVVVDSIAKAGTYVGNPAGRKGKRSKA